MSYAIEASRAFLCRVAETGQGEIYPYWKTGNGRDALARWLGISQPALEHLPDGGASIDWIVGNSTTRLLVRPAVGLPGVYVTVACDPAGTSPIRSNSKD